MTFGRLRHTTASPVQLPTNTAEPSRPAGIKMYKFTKVINELKIISGEDNEVIKEITKKKA